MPLGEQKQLLDLREMAPAEAEEVYYDIPEAQKRLKDKIESQELPVRSLLPQLMERIEASALGSGTFLLQGETGSGKSIYSPIAVWGVLEQMNLPRRIINMQPRRDAASGIAKAIAAVTETELGHEVGYSTSDMNMALPDTQIATITPGILMRYLLQGSINRDNTGAIIIDELHEGSVEYHVVMGLIRMLQQSGRAPLVILASATVDKERFQAYFAIDDKDYLEVEGRTYPVELSYYQPAAEEKQQDDDSYIQEAANCVQQICQVSDEGDILVFMPGAREIKRTISEIEALLAAKEDHDIPVDLLPLYGNMNVQERDKVLRGKNGNGDSGKRRVIIATNIAETSITVPGVKYVVDSCRQRSYKYNGDRGIYEVGTEMISKAQAEQRRGRAGRLGPGSCVRLIKEADFDQLVDHPIAEIHTANLADIALTLIQYNLDPYTFPFIDPPEKEAWDNALAELRLLGFLDEENGLTNLGQESLYLETPFEPRTVRMLLEARKEGKMEAGLVLAAFSREPKVFAGPTEEDIKGEPGRDYQEKKRAAQDRVKAIHNRFHGEGSDWMQMLKVFATSVREGVFEASESDRRSAGSPFHQFADWCRKNYLNPHALAHIAYKLYDYAGDFHLNLEPEQLLQAIENTSSDDLTSILLPAYPDRLFCYEPMTRGLPTYDNLIPAGGVEVNPSPGSVAFEYRPQLILVQAIKEGRGTQMGKDITRYYGENIHPLKLEALHQALPHLFEIKAGGSPLDSLGRGRYSSLIDDFVEFVQVVHKSTGRYLGTIERKVDLTPDERAKRFASAILSGLVSLPCHQYNLELINEIRQDYNVYVLSDLIPIPRLEQWYLDRLNGAATRKEALAVDANLRMNAEDVREMAATSGHQRRQPDSTGILNSNRLNDYLSNFSSRRYSPDSYPSSAPRYEELPVEPPEATGPTALELAMKKAEKAQELTEEVIRAPAVKPVSETAADRNGGNGKTRIEKVRLSGGAKTAELPEVIDPETRERFGEETAFLEVALEGISYYGSLSRKDGGLDESKRVAQVKAARKDRGAIAYDLDILREEINEDPEARPVSIAGKMANIRNRVSKLAQNHGQILVEAYNPDWITDLETAWQAIADAVNTDPDIIEYLNDEGLDPKAVIETARRKLSEKVADWQRNKREFDCHEFVLETLLD